MLTAEGQEADRLGGMNQAPLTRPPAHDGSVEGAAERDGLVYGQPSAGLPGPLARRLGVPLRARAGVGSSPRRR
jgi:hypothetical protein